MLTTRPASLLCRFIAERASGRFSRASANSRDTMLPNSTSSLQPPHFQPSPGGPFLRVSQPQMVTEPSEQARVTANATPRWGNCMDKCWFSSGYGSGQRKHALLHMLYLRMSINCSFICPDIIVTLKVLKLLKAHERVVKFVGKDSSLRSHCGHGMPWVREDYAYPSRWGKYKADKSIIRKT